MPLPQPIEAERLDAFAAALRPRLHGSLRLDALSRALYATDASAYRIPPIGVLVPRSTDDVQAALEEAARSGIPVLARGSGSSLAGSAVGAALVIDTTQHLTRILDLDVEGRTVTVEPGVVLDDLNRHLAPHGLRFGPDPASSSRATLGGMVGTNATGTHSIRVGSVVDWLESAEGFLAGGVPVRFDALDAAAWARKAEGEGVEADLYRRIDAVLTVHEAAIRRDTPRWWRRAGGYRLERLLDAPEVDRGPGRPWDGTRNLAHLLCGAEGGLAVTTKLTFRLTDLPAHTALAVVHFDARRTALEAVGAILETDPAAVELFDRMALRRARAVTEYAPKLHFVRGDPAALLIVEYDGATTAEVQDGLARLRRTLGPGAVVTDAVEEAHIADVWAVRKVGLGLAMSARLPVQPLALIEDAAVPVEHLPDYITRLEGVLEANGTDAVVYAHASAGCLHVRPFIETKSEAGVEAMRRVAEGSAALVKEYGGIIASEHGDGLARSPLNRAFYGEALYAAYLATKRAFDPDGLLNPGKVVEAPPLTSHLRLGPGYRPAPVESGLTFPDADGRDLGVALMAELCNGQAVCRKRGEGTMCPPFMVTGEEKDSTRGRANALREALTGGLDRLTGDEVAEAMDLCVQCKACQAECPASVDLAGLKTVWLSTKWETETPPLRTRLFAHLPRVARRLAGRAAPLVNRANRSRLARRRLAGLGIARARLLPPFARNPFRREDDRSPGDASGAVVLYADTFARFQEPEIPRAAVTVMEAVGVEVLVPPYRCCGRTYLSKGFVPHAKRLARQLADTYAPYAEAGLPIVGLEPSCLLTLRDELRRLLPGDPKAEAVARQAQLFEEWAAANAEALAALDWAPDVGDVLVHGHCHQKALSTMAASRALFEAAGFRYRETGAGCCGMAGSFGYEAEHYRLSLAMAEDRLAPTVRAAPTAAVAAAGTSCRHQIHDVTGRTALHPAVVLAEALA
ncbi:MAG: FAD-linked oxidase C-terminal domain-containing protein [Rubricoccaceae bacterium]|nr:FAD-linked oxidase C-terminal domain-containing protein [Rubricoccaceae bacterium]